MTIEAQMLDRFHDLTVNYYPTGKTFYQFGDDFDQAHPVLAATLYTGTLSSKAMESYGVLLLPQADISRATYPGE